MKENELVELNIKIYERKPGEELEDGEKVTRPRYDFNIFCPESNLDLFLCSINEDKIQEINSQKSIQMIEKYTNSDFQPRINEIWHYLTIKQDQGWFQRQGLMSILDNTLLVKYLKSFIQRNYSTRESLIIKVISDSPDILDLPWDTIRLKRGSSEVELGKIDKITILYCRKYRKINFSNPSFIFGNLKVLLTTAYIDRDTDRNKESFNEELSYIEDKLAPHSSNIKKFIITDFDNFINEINSFDEIDILYFTGHGAPGILGIKDVDGNYITSSQFFNRLSNIGKIPKNIVLNCCMAGLTNYQIGKSFCYDLLKLPGLNSIIGMRYAVDFESSKSFAKKIFEKLVIYKNLYKSFHKAVDKTRTGAIMPFIYLS